MLLCGLILLRYALDVCVSCVLLLDNHCDHISAFLSSRSLADPLCKLGIGDVCELILNSITIEVSLPKQLERERLVCSEAVPFSSGRYNGDSKFCSDQAWPDSIGMSTQVA